MVIKGNAEHKSMEYYLELQYPFNVLADPDGGFVIVFSDLPGCITQADTIEEIPEMAEDARAGWIETEYELGHDIPLPSKPQEYSGKFNLRLPSSLHRILAESAKSEGVSLNQYVVTLLSRGDSHMRLGKQLEDMEARISSIASSR